MIRAVRDWARRHRPSLQLKSTPGISGDACNMFRSEL